MNKMIDEVVFLRGTEVKEFGQPKLMDESFEDEPLIIDTVDVLEELSSYQVYDYVGYDNELEEEIYFESVNEYLNYIEENHGINNLLHSNTFNGSAPVTNHIDFSVFEFQDGFMGDEVLVEMKTHLGYGDVRANYTEPILLKFDSMDDFTEKFLDAGYKTTEIEMEGYELEVSSSIDDNSHEVHADGSYLMTYEGYPELEDLKIEIAERLDVPLNRKNVKNNNEMEM